MTYTKTELETMARHYCIAAVWADAPEGTNPRITSSSRDAARRVCARFLELIGPGMLAELREAHARGYGTHPDCGDVEPLFAAMGHDLWLTSRGHGVGFWDRDELKPSDLGERLSAFCGWRKPIPEPEVECWRGWAYIEPGLPLEWAGDANENAARAAQKGA